MPLAATGSSVSCTRLEHVRPAHNDGRKPSLHAGAAPLASLPRARYPATGIARGHGSDLNRCDDMYRQRGVTAAAAEQS